MKKTDALALFGGVTKAAAALELTHPTVCSWPDELPLRVSDRVRGAALRLRIPMPPHVRFEQPAPAPVAETVN